MARYWIGNGGSWHDTAHWSTTSGGAGGASVPTASAGHDVYFDANSFSSSGQTVTVTGDGGDCLSMDWTGVTNSPTFSISAALACYGDFTLAAGMTFTVNDTYLDFLGGGSFGVATRTMNTAGVAIGGTGVIQVDGRPFALASDLVASGLMIYMGAGELITNNHDVTVGDVVVENPAGALTLGTSTIATRQWYVIAGADVSAASSIIQIRSDATNYGFQDDAGTIYGTVNVGTTIGDAPAGFSFYGANTFTNLNLYQSATSGSSISFESGRTSTVTGTLGLHGNSTYPLKLRATTSGSRFTLSKSSDVLRYDYLDLKDSRATGGSTWFAGANSTDSGNNTGWTFGTPTFTSSITGPLTLAADLDPTATHYGGASGTVELSGSATAERVITPVAGKEYVYRVYQANGTYLGIWNDVASALSFSQRLNTPGTTTTVRLARSASRTVEARENLTDQTGDPLTTEDGNNLVAVFQTSNTVGEDTDVDLNYNVDVYVHYGGFENLLTEDGEEVLAEDGDFIIVAIGAPLGTRVFSGFIVDYSAAYGAQDGVQVTLASHGFELSHEVVKDGTNTTRTYSTTGHDAIIKSVLDTNPGTMSYSSDSIESTGTTITQTFRLNTKLEAIESVYNQSPAGWYWYGSVSENNIHFKEKAVTAHHTLILGKHIKSIEVKRSIEDLRNTVYFVGGDTGGGAILYKKYEDAVSVVAWRQGLHRITDRRFTLTASAETYANKILDRYAGPIYTTTVTLLSEVFGIEEIRLGQMVGFAGFGNFVDDLVLQIVARAYEPHSVTLELGELLPRQQDIIEENIEDLQGEQYFDIPSAPS